MQGNQRFAVKKFRFGGITYDVVEWGTETDSTPFFEIIPANKAAKEAVLNRMGNYPTWDSAFGIDRGVVFIPGDE